MVSSNHQSKSLKKKPNSKDNQKITDNERWIIQTDKTKGVTAFTANQNRSIQLHTTRYAPSTTKAVSG